jgi:hypothetical protein
VDNEVRVYEASSVHDDSVEYLLWKKCPFESSKELNKHDASSYASSYFENSSLQHGEVDESCYLTCCSISPGPSLKLALGSRSGRIAIFDALNGMILNELRQVSFFFSARRFWSMFEHILCFLLLLLRLLITFLVL